VNANVWMFWLQFAIQIIFSIKVSKERHVFIAIEIQIFYETLKSDYLKGELICENVACPLLKRLEINMGR
jgi:hypothetical protein